MICSLSLSAITIYNLLMTQSLLTYFYTPLTHYSVFSLFGHLPINTVHQPLTNDIILLSIYCLVLFITTVYYNFIIWYSHLVFTI